MQDGKPAPPPDKDRKLDEILGKLSARQALAVARRLETERLLGKAALPVDTILEALRPLPRAGQAPRVPTLCRLACVPFEDFLTDAAEAKLPEGLIRRAVIAPWWQGLQHLATAEIAALEEELRGLVAGNDGAAAAAFGAKVAQAVCGWSDTLLARLIEGEGDPALKAIFAGKGVMGDLREIVRILPIGGGLRAGLDAVIAAASREGGARGRRLTDLGPAARAAAAQHYKSLREAFGVHVGYFALALINRLERPWPILRLGRELAWKQEDALVRETEFGAIGRRLLSEFERLARDVRALAAAENALAQLAPLAAALAGYAEACQALLGEIGFRRGSTWAEEAQEQRAETARAVSGALVARIGQTVLAVLPQRRGDGAGAAPDITAIPGAPGLARALDGARCLVSIRDHAGTGFGNAVRGAAEQAAAEVAQRMARLVEAARAAPGNAAVAVQIEAASVVASILFPDARGEALRQQLRAARGWQHPPPDFPSGA